MKIFIIIMLLFSFNLYSQRCGGTSTSYGRLWDRSIEYLHKTLSESKDRDDREYMSNKLLVSDTGNLIENKYFDTSTTKKITNRNLSQNLYDKNTLHNVLKLVKRDYISYLVITEKEMQDKHYVFIDTMSSHLTDNEIYFKKYNTLALYVYVYDREKGEYNLESQEIFRQEKQ